MKATRFLPLLLAAGLFATGLSTACVVATPHGAALVRVRPPRAVVELRSISPGPNHVWIPGHHRWDGSGYTWVPGRWEVLPSGRTGWVGGRWRGHGGQWYWVDGHWR